MSAVLGRHPHHLAVWDPAGLVSVRVDGGAWEAPSGDDLGHLVGDTVGCARVFTLPGWPLRELDEVTWTDGTPTGDALEREQFTRFSERVLELWRFMGVPLADQTTLKLVATTVTEPTDEGNPAGVVLANVGEGPLRVMSGVTLSDGRAVSLLLPRGHGCVLPVSVGAWRVGKVGDVEFALHLEAVTVASPTA